MKYDKVTSSLAAAIRERADALSLERISQAGFDRTFTGVITSVTDLYCEVTADTGVFTIDRTHTPEDVILGDSVRLYFPNNDMNHGYIERITDAFSYSHPVFIKWFDDPSTLRQTFSYTDDAGRHSFTVDLTDSGYTGDYDMAVEVWKYVDTDYELKPYLIEVANRDTVQEECTKIIFPDATEMTLEGFFTT